MAHHFSGAFAAGTHHYTIRFHKIVHGHAFAQKFGVRHYIEHLFGQIFCHDGRHFFSGAHWNRAFIHNDFVVRDDSAQIFGHAHDVGKIGRTIVAGRSGECEENNAGFVHGLPKISGEVEATFFCIPLEKDIQTGFKNRDFASFEAFYFFVVVVNTNDVVARFVKTSSGNQPYVASSNDSDVHIIS